MTRQGPHHGAQKSISTGRSLVTTPSKLASVTCTMNSCVLPFGVELIDSYLLGVEMRRDRAEIQPGRRSMNRATSFMCSSKRANTGIERYRPCLKRSFVTKTAISSGASSAVRLNYGTTWRIAHAIESGLRDAAAGGRRPRGHPGNARAVRPGRSDGLRHHLVRRAPLSHELLDVAVS